MHSTKFSSCSNTKSSSSTPPTANIQQYQHCPPISTLRRASRPTNINLPIFDHNHAQQSNDSGIYSAPIYYIKQSNNQQQQQQQHIHQASQPYTAALPYAPQQHIQVSPPHQNSSQQQNIHLYQQQQQQHIVDPYNDHQHTPHTFPLQTSPSHYHQYFYFPPSALQINVASNGHQSTNTSQPSTPTHNNHLRSTQIQKQQQQQQQWSNPVLSSLMVKRMNENPTSMSMDDDEDPSASIDALVADVDSNSQDSLGDEQSKPINQSKTSSTMPPGTISPPSHLYIRSKSHILTTPPNPLASDDHPDNQLKIKVGNNYKQTYSPIPSAGFELTSNINNKLSSSSNKTARFTFDTNLLERTEIKNSHNGNLVNDNEEDNHDIMLKPLIINTDVCTTRISSNSLIQDDNSNQSSTNSSSQHTSSRIFGQMLKSSEQQMLSSPSPLSNDIKLSSLDHDSMQANINANSSQRHSCVHPNCNKTFTNKSALAKHKLTHSQDRKHVCSKCNKGFKRLDHLNGHMLTHQEEKPHKCGIPNCSRTYCDARSLKRHIENTHQDILAAIHESGQEEYKKFLPDKAFVKTKDLSLPSEFSIDSVDSSSPRSLVDSEPSFNIRTSTGTKSMITYTFDEEKSIECQICKKSFKSGAALNGHMRLHGGFIEKPALLPSTSTKEKTKRTATATATKRKRTDSPSASITIKTEAHDRSMNISANNFYQQQSSFPVQPSSSNTIQNRFYDRTISSPGRPSPSASSSMISTPTTTIPQYQIQNHMRVQSSAKQTRKQNQGPTHVVQPSQINLQNVITPFDTMPNSQLFTNVRSPSQQYEEKLREAFSNEHNAHFSQSNGMSSHNPYLRPSQYQSPSTISPFQMAASPSVSINSIAPALLQRFLIQNGERRNVDFSSQHQPFSSPEEQMRYTPSPRFVHIPVPNSIASLTINTPVTSPYSNQTTSHGSPASPAQKCNKHNDVTTILNNSIQPSSVVHSSLSSLNVVPPKPIENPIKQQTTVEDNARSSTAVLEIVPDVDSPNKKNMSGFLISTPSSTGTGLSSSSSSSSTSSNTHFHYDDIPQPKEQEPTPSSFHWPSHLRRQLSLNLAKQTLNPLPSTPYTPPPMLSPFRRGPGLYYRVFSHPGTCAESPSIPTTPLPPSTPLGEESTVPKINIGRDYQANIPKLRTNLDDDDTATSEELLFSPAQLSCLDEKSLETFEELNRRNPFLFSPRDSPKAYPLELIYMLLHEYNGDLSRTLAALLEGTAKDIKQCRQLHCYHFLDCDTWTKEEIDAFTKAIQNSEKNFGLVSRAVGTKSVKQCIEFYYMPKVSVTARKILSTRTTAVITRRKRFQINKAKQQLLDDEISSSSPFSEFRIDDDGSTMNSDSSPAAQFSCDIDECSQIFTSERACRAHRKDHRRTNNNMTTSWTVTKRSRNVD
ncbi:unnamed protein product [Rotaria socialis]|uniref:Uncharacterized protein n=3 Tax=Bdelloidea TaxID=44578 RepID=A0A817UL92_9BILA|nr:unnamed protein product [Rotaria socialis]CAF4580426.1 unnamed protein product [Rotaria socialis]